MIFQVTQECDGDECKCKMKLECKHSRPNPYEKFDLDVLKKELLKIKAGGSEELKVSTDNEAECLKICKNSVFEDGCYNGYKCNAGVSECDHTGCICEIKFSCKNGRTVISNGKKLESEDFHLLNPHLKDIANGGKKQLHFITNFQEPCSTACENKVIKNTCNAGPVSCKVC